MIQDNAAAVDWSNNLFAGVAYFLLGDKDEGIACVEANVDFGYEEAVSKAVLAEMKKGELDAFTLYALQRDIEAAIENPPAKPSAVKEPEPVKQTSGKRRDLTKEEIVAITTKYGYSSSENYAYMDKWDHPPITVEIYTSFWSKGVLDYGAAFCSDGIHTHEEKFLVFFFHRGDFLSYDELRNNSEIDIAYLKKRFPEQGPEFFFSLMELKELE